ELRDKANPEHSPFYSRRPDLFVKRIIRGMLPYKQPKGKTAFKLLKVYMGPAKDIKDAKAYDTKAKKALSEFNESLPVAQAKRARAPKKVAIPGQKKPSRKKKTVVVTRGKRKEAIARASMSSGSGRITINGVSALLIR